MASELTITQEAELEIARQLQADTFKTEQDKLEANITQDNIEDTSDMVTNTTDFVEHKESIDVGGEQPSSLDANTIIDGGTQDPLRITSEPPPDFGAPKPTAPTDPVQAPATTAPTEPTTTTESTPTEVVTGTQDAPSSTPLVPTDPKTLLQEAEADPMGTLAQRGLTQEVVRLQVGEDEIIADPTLFNLAIDKAPAQALKDNIVTATASAAAAGTIGPAQQAAAVGAIIAKDYALSLLTPEEMGQNLERLRDEEPMQAASMTLEMNALLDGMENGEIPLWAKPAVTKVEQQLAARGISASSVGRDALFNAIIQSAMPIAQQNASFKQDANKTNYNAKVQAIFSDVAAENAAKQFNATTINQKNQFMTGLQSQLDSQTASRRDAVSMFNAGETNNNARAQAQLATQVNIANAQNATSVSTFNAGQLNQAGQFSEQLTQQREMFNSQQSMAITQSNVTWRRQTNQINTALENQVNQTNTQNAFNLSNQALSFLWQEERDEAHWEFQATENEKNRRNSLEAAVLSNEAAVGAKAGRWAGNLAEGLNVLDTVLDYFD